MTGAYPEKHGISNNEKPIMGVTNSDWFQFAESVKCRDIFSAAKEAGLTTASVFWPVTGCHKDIDYLIDEYAPLGNEPARNAYLRSGTSPELYDRVVAKNIEGVVICRHPETDYFILNCACDIIREYKPNLLMLHPSNVDSCRHSYGVFSPQLKTALDETEEFLGMLVSATKEAGVYEETNFLIVSDHGQMNYCRSSALNSVFLSEGLIEVDENNHIKSWKAFCKPTGFSAQIYLKDKKDKRIYDLVYNLLCGLRDTGVNGIREVYTTAEIKKLERLDGDFSFVVDSDLFTIFQSAWNVKPIHNNSFIQYYCHGCHGHWPDKGPQPTLIAFGPAIKKGAVVERRPIVDEAPTFAKILDCGFLPDADGTPITEIII